MDENEKKEELKKDIDEVKVQEQKVEEGSEEKEEYAENSEEYYDEIDYQTKEDVEKKKAVARSVIREAIDWVVCFIIAYIIYLFINYFLVSFPGVKQRSMYPTVVEGERVMAVRPWLAGDFKYGDIVTFEAPIETQYYVSVDEQKPVAQYDNLSGLTLFLYNFMDVGKINYIKRVIGLPGDHIVIKDGAVYRNDEMLNEPYLRVQDTPVDEGGYADIVVAEDTIFVMGDNRPDSKDSRSFGSIPIKRINGKVVCRIWPLNKIGAIDK